MLKINEATFLPNIFDIDVSILHNQRGPFSSGHGIFLHDDVLFVQIAVSAE